MGIGGQEAGSKLVTIQTDMPGDIDGILEAVRKIILMGEVRSIVLRDGEPLTYQRVVRSGDELRPGESTSSFAELSLMDVVRQISMEEYKDQIPVNNSHGIDPFELVTKMIVFMEFEGWIVTHILLGEGTKFWSWLTIPEIIRSKMGRFLGAHIEYEKTLPNDVFIFCGSRTKNATIPEVSYALKGNIT